jgi:hypothetical protein
LYSGFDAGGVEVDPYRARTLDTYDCSFLKSAATRASEAATVGKGASLEKVLKYVVAVERGVREA